MESIRIPLTQGKYATIDADDYQRVSQFKWHAYQSRYTWYAATNTPRQGGRQGKIRLHRLIMGVTESAIMIDHINGDGLDCTKKNLDISDATKNRWNRRWVKTGLRGLRCDKTTGAWFGYIPVFLNDGSMSPDEAAIAYKRTLRAILEQFPDLRIP